MLPLPEPSPGLDWRVLGDPGTWGMWKSWQVPGRAVMDEGKSPLGQEEGTGLCFSKGDAQESRPGPGGLGLCRAPSQFQLEHQEGQESLFLPRKEGVQGGCCSLQAVGLLKSKWELHALQGLYLHPVPYGTREEGLG